MKNMDAAVVVGFAGKTSPAGGRRGTRRTWIPIAFYVKSVSWNGDNVGKATITKNKSEAAEFRLITALRFAQQWNTSGYSAFITVK